VNGCDEVSAFMANVVAWPVSPTDAGAGYVNLHYSVEDRRNPKKKIVTGWPTRDLNGFMSKVGWSLGTNYIKDLWFCTSLQSEAGKNSKGNAKAVRRAALAMKQKSIWVDIDVEPNNPKKYGTQEEALKALLLFAATVKLPTPSAIVFSGGGLHVYWISKDPLTPAEWQAYASGLKTLLLVNAIKCDSGLTTDIARILRVPGTLNHKYDPPRPVQLSTLPLVLYDFEKQLSFLKGFSTPSTAPKAGHTLFAEGADMASFKRGPAFKIENEPGLEAGIDKFSEQLLEGPPIFQQCGFLKHALKTGGADYDNPLWNLSLLCSTFMENGNAVAHAISQGHKSYSKDDTQAQYVRKMAERHDRGLGYPQCTTIQGAGCKSCATCPLLGKVKSPLNIKPVVTATVTDASSGSSSSGSGPTRPGDLTIYYYPGNEEACRTALDRIVAADKSTFRSGDILTILRVPDRNEPALGRWSGDLPGTTRALAADVIERAEKLVWMVGARGTVAGGKEAGSKDAGSKDAAGKDATDKGAERWKRGKPPRDFCTDYIVQRRGRYGARPLVGIARVPFMRDDGSTNAEPGYDVETGVFVDRAPKLTIPAEPTLDDAKAALRRVMRPFEYYLFEDPENGPHQIFAANLTALERPYMKTAPMFVVNGAQAGTGKGQICRAIGQLALSTTPPFMSWGHDDDEFKKRLDTMLLASPVMVVIDNCNGRVLRGDTLEMILSEGEATIRQFGKLEAVTIRPPSFIMANGNNTQISGDMSRRGIKTNVLPRSHSPEQDTFPFTPEDYVMEHRETLLSDYYTIMRAYRLAGMPRSGLAAVGSFGQWERKVRDLVYWLTDHDLSGGFQNNKKDDPEQQEDAALLSALYHLFGEEWFKAAQADAVLKRATENRPHQSVVTCPPGPSTLDAMKQSNVESVDELIRGIDQGAIAVDPVVLEEIKVRRDAAARTSSEYALLEATEQKFGAKQDYAKTIGTWARGVQNKFVDGFVLQRQEDPHTKINRIKVRRTSSSGNV
jgi:hypothetical protein